MKNIILFAVIAAILFSFTKKSVVGPRNYYVSATGNDSSDGLTTSTPWQTLSKVNNASFTTNDTIRFKAGDTWYGSIVPPRSSLNYDAYGTGAKPLITGMQTLTGWTNSGGGIWKVNIPAATSNLRIITKDGYIQRMGRYPNYNPGTGGLLFYETHSSRPANPSITDVQLTTSPYNWTGAEVVLWKYSYVIGHSTITNHSGGTLTYQMQKDMFNTNDSLYGSNGYGYFIQNDLRTLDSLGEWYFNTSTKDLSVYFGLNAPTSYTMKAATQDTLFNCGDGGANGTGRTARTNISVRNIAFEGGNVFGIYNFNGSNTIVQNCTTNYCGTGLFFWYIPAATITGSTFTNNLFNGMQIAQGPVSPDPPTTLTVNGNTIKTVGLWTGLGTNNSTNGSSIGLQTAGYNAQNIQNNVIDSTGYHGIWFGGQNILIQNNFISNYCAEQDDGGGIYTFAEKDKPNRRIDGNIIINGIGARKSRPTDAWPGTWAIYTDGSSKYVNITNNTASKADGGGYLMNTGQFINIWNNTFYDVPVGININRFTDAADPRVTDIRTGGNIFFPTVNNFFFWESQLNNPSAISIQTDLTNIGTWDSNYYRNDLAAPFDWFYHLANDGSGFTDPPSKNLAGWQAYISSDTHSQAIATGARTFEYNSTMAPRVIDFTGYSKMEPNGTVHNNKDTLAAFESMIYYDNGVVSGGNIPPVATITGGGTITLPTNSTNVSGSSSIDPDGSIASYAWSKISGPATFNIVSPAAATTVFNNLVAGTYQLQLTVTDNIGATSTATVNVVVSAISNGNKIYINRVPKN